HPAQVNTVQTTDQVDINQEIDKMMKELPKQINAVQRNKIFALFQRHKAIFSTSEYDVGHCTVTKHRINLKDPHMEPISRPAYKISHSERAEVDKHITAMK